MKKKCSHCDQNKELDKFYNDKNAPDGKQNVCRVCKRELKRKAKPKDIKRAKKLQAIVKETEANGGDMIGAYLTTQPVQNRQSAANGLAKFLATLEKHEGDKLEVLASSDEANNYIMKYLKLAEEQADAGNLQHMIFAIDKILMRTKAQKIDIPQVSSKRSEDLLASIDALLEGKKEEGTDD